MQEAEQKKRLIEFYGRDCPHCVRMRAVVEDVERNLSVDIEKLEVWQNRNNYLLLEKICSTAGHGGTENIYVPVFYNEASEEILSGEQDYDSLAVWAESNFSKYGQ